MEKIECMDLDRLGASAIVLDFYNNTDPLEIFRLKDGTYSIRGAIYASAADSFDLLNTLECIASECANASIEGI